MKFLFNTKLNNRLGIIFLFIADILVLLGIFYISAFIRKYILPFIFYNMPAFSLEFKMYLWIFMVWLFVLTYEGTYSKRFTFWDEVKVLWKCSFFSSLTIFSVLFIGKQGVLFSRSLILMMFILSLVLLPLLRIGIKRMIFNLGMMKRKVLIIGAGQMGQQALRSLRNEPNLGYDVVGFLDDDVERGKFISGVKVHSNVDKVERYLVFCGILDVIIAHPNLVKKKLTNIINHIQHKVDNILYVPDLSGIAVLGTELRHFFNEQSIVIEIKNNLANPINYYVKRLSDFIIGFMLLFALLLPLIAISFLIRFTSRGPVLYKHERVGKNGKLFMCYKFRTMYYDASNRLKRLLESDLSIKKEWDTYQKLVDDPRVTKIGKFLRSTSLDELPQIINVLKGEMSLVGPRPVTQHEIDHHYKESADLCFSVPPGVTGLWQVSGRSNASYNERISLDSWYVRNWNLWLDIVILLRTIKVVIKREGAR